MSFDEGLTDLQLVEAARRGVQEAVVQLWQRHYSGALATARRVARQPRDAEELAADAFSQMLSAIAAGGGPTSSVGAYLATSVRNLAVSRIRHSSAGDLLTDDHDTLDQLSGQRGDPVAKHSELGVVREAFAALPRRWQVVLWRTAVDQDSNILVAEELGMSPNAVAALSRRARKGLRTAYLQAHLSTHGIDPACERHVRRLVDLALDATAAPEATLRHVEGCEKCRGRLAELLAVETQMAGLLGSAVLGLTTVKPAAAALIGTTSGTPAPAGGSGVTAGTHSAWTIATKLVAAAVVSAVVGVVLVLAINRSQQPLREQPVAVPAAGHATTPSATRSPAATTQPPGPSTVAPTRSTPPQGPAPSPLVLKMAVNGGSGHVEATIDVTVQGTTGPLRARLDVPAGVTFTKVVSGVWRDCAQADRVLTCTSGHRDPGRWSGTIGLAWPVGVTGTLTSSVLGDYADGSTARASVSATWAG